MKTLNSSVCSRLWRLCRFCRLCKLCELCKLLDDRLWLATSVLTEILPSMLPDMLFDVLLLFNARMWRIIQHCREVLGERLLIDNCINCCRVFLSKGVLGREVAAEASSMGPAPGALWREARVSFVPTLELQSCEA